LGGESEKRREWEIMVKSEEIRGTNSQRLEMWGLGERKGGAVCLIFEY